MNFGFSKITIFILFLKTLYSEVKSSKYKIYNNVQVSENFEKQNLIESYSSNSKLHCLSKCNQLNNICMMVAIQNQSCKLYGSVATENEIETNRTDERKLFKKLERNCSNKQFFDGINCSKSLR